MLLLCKVVNANLLQLKLISWLKFFNSFTYCITSEKSVYFRQIPVGKFKSWTYGWVKFDWIGESKFHVILLHDKSHMYNQTWLRSYVEKQGVYNKRQSHPNTKKKLHMLV